MKQVSQINININKIVIDNIFKENYRLEERN